MRRFFMKFSWSLVNSSSKTGSELAYPQKSDVQVSRTVAFEFWVRTRVSTVGRPRRRVGPLESIENHENVEISVSEFWIRGVAVSDRSKRMRDVFLGKR